MNHVSTSWTKEEDQKLTDWIEKGLAKGWNKTYVFQFVGQKLKRSAEECAHRWQVLWERKERAEMGVRISQLEKVITQQQAQLEKIKKDLQFYEWVLLEEYHLLLKILGEDKEKVRIHHI